MNRTKLFSKIASVLLLSFWAAYSVAQDSGAVESSNANNGGATPPLTLFESIEVAENRPNAPSRPTRETRATMFEPVFTLVGTSRIGSKSSAILRHQNGETIKLAINLDGATPITGYESYSVSNLGAGRLSVSMPANVPCSADEAKGVSCTGAANTALLQLVNGTALVRAAPVADQSQSAEQTLQAGESVNSDLAANPFEALRAARANGRSVSEGANQGSADGRNGRFTPRRIAPEDVPQGMRVVSTPFGDRLVEQ